MLVQIKSILHIIFSLSIPTRYPGLCATIDTNLKFESEDSNSTIAKDGGEEADNELIFSMEEHNITVCHFL